MGVTTVIKDYGTDILNAIRENDLQRFKSIVEKHLKSERKIQKLCISDIKHKPTKKFACPLILAARQDDPRILKYMMDRAVDPNFIHHTIYSSKRKEIVTALHIAVDLGLYDSVQILLDANADCNIGDHNQETPLHIAVKKADRILVRILLSKGADPVLLDRRGNAALHIATLYGHLQLVQTLLKYDADVYQKGQSGAIPPHIAAKEGHIHLIQLFCLRDVGNINIKIPCYADRREKAPIHLAAENGHVETVRALISQFDADVNLKDSDRNTPLHCVVLNQYNPHRMRDKDDFTEAARMLLKARVSINEKNIYGDTALHLAAMNQYQKIVEMLLAVGANPFLENDEHLKPIDVVPDFDPVTKQLLKNAMLGPRPPITASLDSLRKGYNLSPTPSDTQSFRKGHGIGYLHNSDPELNGDKMERSMSFVSQSTMSIGSSVFEERGSRGLGPPPPPKNPPPISRDQESNQSHSSKSRSHESDDSLYNEINQKDTLPIYTRPSKVKKTSGQQTSGPRMASTGQQTATEHYQTREQQTEVKKVMSMGTQPEVYDDRMSIVSDISYTKEKGMMANELQRILNKNRKQMRTYDDDASDTYSIQDTESEYMSVQSDKNKDKHRPVPRPRSRSSSKPSSARQTPIIMDKPLPPHPEEKVYENIEYDEEGNPYVRGTAPERPQRPPPRGQHNASMEMQQQQFQQMQEQIQQQMKQLQELQLQQAELSKKAVSTLEQKPQTINLDQLPPGIQINRQPKNKPGSIEVQYGTGPITISLDTHGSQYSVQQHADGVTYLVSDDGQFKYSLNDMLEQHNTAQTSQHIYIPQYQGDLSADLDDTEIETNSIISNDAQQEAVRQAIQQKVVELTETRYGDAQNPDISQILQEQAEDEPRPPMTPTKQARKPRKDTPARPTLQKNSEQRDQRYGNQGGQDEEEELATPDQSPNVSPKYKNFQQALAFAKSQQAELVQQQQKEQDRLLEEQKQQQEQLQEYLRHQQEQLQQEEEKQQKRAKKQSSQLQKILQNQNMVSTPETNRWNSKQSSDTAIIENTREESPKPNRVQMRPKTQWQQQQFQQQREPRQTSQYMSSDFPSSSMEDLVEKEPSYPSDSDEDDEMEDIHPSQQKIQETHQLSQQSHDLYYSITPGIGSKDSGPGSSQPEARPFVIQPAPSNKVSETPTSVTSNDVSLVGKDHLKMAQVNEVEVLQSSKVVVAESLQVIEMERVESEEVLQQYEVEPGASSQLSQSIEFLAASPKAGRAVMSPTRSLGARTPDSLWSVGSSGSGLNMRVTGEMPKAYTRKTKAAARTAFIKAPPQGIESSSECSDVEYLATSPAFDRSHHAVFTESPKPVNPALSVSPTSPISTSPPSSTGSPPEKDPETKKKLLGAAIPKPYKTFGKIEPKIDALLEAMEEASNHGLSDFDDEDINASRDLETFTEIPVMMGSPRAVRPRPSTARPTVEARVTKEKEEIKAEIVQEKKEIKTQIVQEIYDIQGNYQNKDEDSVETINTIPMLQGSPKAVRPIVKARPRKPRKTVQEKKLEPELSTAPMSQHYVGEEEIQIVEQGELNRELAGESVAKSSFKKNIKVREDEPETYQAEAVEQMVNSSTRQKTVIVKEQRWQGENVIETLTTTVKAGEISQAEKVAVSEIINSSQDEESTSRVEVEQMVNSPTRKKTVIVKEQRWQGENVIETLTTTVKAGEISQAEMVAVSEIINSSQDEESTSSSESSSSESSYEGVMEYTPEPTAVRPKQFIEKAAPIASISETEEMTQQQSDSEENDEQPFTQQAETVKKKPHVQSFGRDIESAQQKPVKKRLPITDTITEERSTAPRQVTETSIDDAMDEDELFRQQLKKQASQLSQRQGWKRGSQELHPCVEPADRPLQIHETDIDAHVHATYAETKRQVKVPPQSYETDIDVELQNGHPVMDKPPHSEAEPGHLPSSHQGPKQLHPHETDIDSHLQAGHYIVQKEDTLKQVHETDIDVEHHRNQPFGHKPVAGKVAPQETVKQVHETDIDVEQDRNQPFGHKPVAGKVGPQETVKQVHETEIDVEQDRNQSFGHEPVAGKMAPQETDIDADLDLRPTKLPAGPQPSRPGALPSHVVEQGLPQHNMSTDLADQEVAFFSAVGEEKKHAKVSKKKVLASTAEEISQDYPPNDPAQLQQIQQQEQQQVQIQQQQQVQEPSQKPARIQGRAAARRQQQQPQGQAAHIPATVFKTYEEEQTETQVPEEVKPQTQVLPASFAAPEKSKKKGGFWSLSSMRKKKDKGVKGSQESLSAASGEETVSKNGSPEDKTKKKSLFGKRKGEKTTGDQPTLTLVEMPVTPEVQHLAISPEKAPSSGGSEPGTPTSVEGFEGTVMGAPVGSNLDRSDTIRESGKERRKAGFFSLGSMRTKKKDKAKDKKGEQYGAVPYTESTEDLSAAGAIQQPKAEEEVSQISYESRRQELQRVPQQGIKVDQVIQQEQKQHQQQTVLPIARVHQQEYTVQKQNEIFDIKQHGHQQQHRQYETEQQRELPRMKPEERTLSETNLDEVFAAEKQKMKSKKPPRPRYASQETNLDDVPVHQSYSQSTPDFQNAAFSMVMGMNQGGQAQQQKQPKLSGSDLMSQMWAEQQQGTLPSSKSVDQIPPDVTYDPNQLPPDVQYGQAGAHPKGRRYFKKHERPLQPIKHINKSLEDVAFANLKANLRNGNGNNGHHPHRNSKEMQQQHLPLQQQPQEAYQQQKQHQQPQPNHNQQQSQHPPQQNQQSQEHPPQQRQQQQQLQWQPPATKQPEVDDAQRVAQMWKENQDHKEEMQQILQSVSDVAMVSAGEDALRYEGHPSDDGSSLQSASGTITPIQWGSSSGAGIDKHKAQLEALAVAAGLQEMVQGTQVSSSVEVAHKPSEVQGSQKSYEEQALPMADAEPVPSALREDHVMSFDMKPAGITDQDEIKEDIQHYRIDSEVRATRQYAETKEMIQPVTQHAEQAEMPEVAKDRAITKITHQEELRSKAPSPKPSVPQKPAHLKWGTGNKPKIAAKPAVLPKPSIKDNEDIEATEAEIPSTKALSTEARRTKNVPQIKDVDATEDNLHLSEGPIETDEAPIPYGTPEHAFPVHQHGGTPEVVDMDSYDIRAPIAQQQPDYIPSKLEPLQQEIPRQPQDKIRRKKAKKQKEELKFKDAMSDTEVGKHSRKRKSLEANIYSEAEAFDMEPAPRDPGKSLQEAAMESITAGLANRPRQKPHKPWWQESDRPINYTRGVYRPPTIQFRPSTGDGGSGRYDDSHIATRNWSERSSNFATESEGEADTEEYPNETSFDVGPAQPYQPYQHPHQRYSTRSEDNDSVFAAPSSPAHSSVSSSKRVTIVEGKKGKGKKKKRKDHPPRIMEPGPVDFSQYPVTARLWMEQVDRKTVQKSKTMSLMVMPEGTQPPEELCRHLPAYESTSDDVFLPPQWVIARGRTLRKKSKRSSSTLSVGRNTSTGVDSDVEVSPDRPMSPGRQVLLFFRVGSNWRDLAWILFDGIYSEQETLRLIKDIQLKNPGDLSQQVRDLMHRWWKKKKGDATIEELQRALDIVSLAYIQEEMLDQKNSLTSFTDTEDDLDISEVSDTDPDVSRLIGEYEVRSMNSSFDCENAPNPPYHIPPEQMMARLSQRGMLRSGKSKDSLGHHSSYTHDSSRDSLLDDGDRKFLIVTPQLKHADYRHETTI